MEKGEEQKNGAYANLNVQTLKISRLYGILYTNTMH